MNAGSAHAYAVLCVDEEQEAGARLIDKARLAKSEQSPLLIGGQEFFAIDINEGNYRAVWQILLSTSREDLTEPAEPTLPADGGAEAALILRRERRS